MRLENNDLVINYLNNVCSNVKNKKLHKEIKEELLCHIEESALIHLKIENDENIAIKKALESMGDYKEIGESLNKVHKQNTEWSIIISAVIISLVGILALYYVSNIQSPYFLSRHITFSIIGLICFLLASYFNYSKIKTYSKYIYGFSIFLIMFGSFFNQYINGTKYFFTIGSFSINLAELIPILLLLSLCDLIKDFSYYNTKKSNFLKLLALTILPGFLLTYLGNLFCIMIYLIGILAILKLKGFKNKYLIISLLVIFSLFAMFILSAPYRLYRITGFLNPSADPYGSGYVYTQIKEVLENSVLLGQAPNLNPHSINISLSDFILTFIIYKFGYLAGFFTVAISCLLLFKISKALLKVKNSYNQSLILVVLTTLSVKFIFGILVNLGISPAFDIAIPFLSYGGTSAIINFILLGLVINIYKVKTLTDIENLNVCK